MTIADLIKHLESYDPSEPVAYDLWMVDDVLTDENPETTREQAIEVLGRMERYKDATIGLNWDVLNYHLDEVMREAAETAKK